MVVLRDGESMGGEWEGLGVAADLEQGWEIGR